MKRRILLSILLLTIPLIVFADAFVPEFDKMQFIRCDYEETLYNQDNSVASVSKQHRFYRLDDEYSKIYLQKEPIDYITRYDDDGIEFNIQSMDDDRITTSHISIDRTNGKYTSESEVTYDNPAFGTARAKAAGVCMVGTK